MTKDELISFLKENLKVHVDVDEYNPSYSNSSGIKVTVRLELGDDVISENYGCTTLN